MKITYNDYNECKMTVNVKEVHSDEYEQQMKFLKILKQMGYVHEIEACYSETGWTLYGYSDMIKDCGYCLTGEWDKESE